MACVTVIAIQRAVRGAAAVQLDAIRGSATGGREEGGVAKRTFWDMLDGPAREALTETGRTQVLRDGQTYMIQGERGDRVCVIMEGQIKLCMVSDHGEETVLDLLGPGDIVGAMDAIDGLPRAESAVAKGMTTVVTFSGERLRETMDAYPGTGLVLLRVLNERLRDSNELRSARGGTKHRVTTLVYQVANRYGRDTPEGGEVAINPPLTGEEFASWAGTSRGSAGRAMSWLYGRGVVRRERRKSREIIVNWRKLRQVLRDLGLDHSDDDRR
jgi:CRP/FNR family cyclic AMP-dependent transcriptional regulator